MLAGTGAARQRMTRWARRARSGGSTALADDAAALALGRATPDACLLPRWPARAPGRRRAPRSRAHRLGVVGLLIVVRVEDRTVEAPTCSEFPPFDLLRPRSRPLPELTRCIGSPRLKRGRNRRCRIGRLDQTAISGILRMCDRTGDFGECAGLRRRPVRRHALGRDAVGPGHHLQRVQRQRARSVR